MKLTWHAILMVGVLLVGLGAPAVKADTFGVEVTNSRSILSTLETPITRMIPLENPIPLDASNTSTGLASLKSANRWSPSSMLRKDFNLPLTTVVPINRLPVSVGNEAARFVNCSYESRISTGL